MARAWRHSALSRYVRCLSQPGLRWPGVGAAFAEASSCAGASPGGAAAAAEGATGPSHSSSSSRWPATRGGGGPALRPQRYSRGFSFAAEDSCFAYSSIDSDSFMASQEHDSAVSVYAIEVITGDFRGAGTTDEVTVRLYGDEGFSEEHLLLEPDAKPGAVHEFKRGSRRIFKLATQQLGKLRRVQVGLRLAYRDHIHADNWFLDKLRIVSPDGQLTEFPYGDWLGDSGDGELSGAPALPRAVAACLAPYPRLPPPNCREECRRCVARRLAAGGPHPAGGDTEPEGARAGAAAAHRRQRVCDPQPRLLDRGEARREGRHAQGLWLWGRRRVLHLRGAKRVGRRPAAAAAQSALCSARSSCSARRLSAGSACTVCCLAGITSWAWGCPMACTCGGCRCARRRP